MNYFLYGSESYILKQQLSKIINENSDGNQINTVFYDGQAADFSIEVVLEDANTISLFSDRKVIVIENPGFLFGQPISDDQLTLLNHYLRDASTFSTMIFYVELSDADRIDQRRKAFKLLSKECRMVSVMPLSPEEFKNRVMQDLRENGISIDAGGMKELISRLPINIANWKSELQKLVLYGQPLKAVDIKHLISRTLEDDVFILVNAVVRRDLKKSIETWQDLNVMRRDPIELVAILASQFRFMYQCIILSRKLDNQAIAENLGAKPIRVSITLNNSRNVKASRVLSLLDKLATLDQKIKYGMIDKQLGFELFLIEATR